MSEAFERGTVGEIVAGDVRAAGVFERFGIDFCCDGRRSLADACRAAGADPAAVEQALQAAFLSEPSGPDDVTGWPVDRLIDHIVATHHAYVRSALPTIERRLATLVDAHAARHPELRQIAASFDRLSGDLLQHMMKEEHVLFPYIRELAGDHGSLACPFGTVRNPIQMMEREHQEAGDELRIIRSLSNGYTVPEDGCTTYRAAFAELAQFERDLHRHVHLENNLLFPKAIKLELEQHAWDT